MTILPIHTGSSGNMYIITTYNNNKFLLECGLNKNTIIKVLMNMDLSISDFKGCFVTHVHKDHCEAVNWAAKYIPVFSNESLSKKYGTVMIPPNKTYSIEDLKVLPFNVEHGNVENYGYMFKDDIDKILFVTDFSRFEANIFSIKFTEIFIECNYNSDLIEEYTGDYKENRQINTHCSVEILRMILNNLDLSICKKINLIHPSNDYCDKEKSIEYLKKYFPNTNIEFAKNLI